MMGNKNADNFFSDYYNTYYTCTVENPTPIPMECFLKVGISPDVYCNYIGIIAQLYGQMLAVNRVDKKTYHKLISFCVEHRLVSADSENCMVGLLVNIRADFALLHYRLQNNKQKWLRNIRPFEEFRFYIEFLLSLIDQKHELLVRKYGIRFDDTTNKLVKMDTAGSSLNSNEYANLYNQIQYDFVAIRTEIKHMLLNLPDRYDEENFSEINRWLYVYDKLKRKCNVIGDLLEFISKVQEQHSVPELTSSDYLYITVGNRECSTKEHFQHSMAVSVRFLDGTTRVIKVSRCFECQRYYITLDEFVSTVSRYGTPTVYTRYVSDGAVWDQAGMIATESIFKQYGYNVNQTENLSTEKRHQLLKDIIKLHIRTKEETILFLSMLISVNGKKKENWLAVQKWKDDLLFISNL